MNLNVLSIAPSVECLPLRPGAVALVLPVSYICFPELSTFSVFTYQKPEEQRSCLSFLSLIPSTHSCHNLSAASISPDDRRRSLWSQEQRDAVSQNLSPFENISPSVNVCLLAEGDLKFDLRASTLFF